jgi:hypothetical protein
MGIDRPDDPDVPRDNPSDRPADRPPPETRFRQEAYDDLRAETEPEERTEPSARSEPGARSNPERRSENAQQPEPVSGTEERTEPAARSESEQQSEKAQQPEPVSSWEENAKTSRWMWTEYKRRWPSEERPAIDRSNDPPGSWRGEGNQFLNPADNQRVEAAYDRILDLEKKRITPALLAIEGQDSQRHLVGLEHCRKGLDRIKEKISGTIKDYRRSPEEAVSLVPDAIRFTFQYDEAHYTQGVLSEIDRIKQQGFKLNIRRNSWSGEQYKGINSQWIEPDTGQRFEVQFHTRISSEAKEITHEAYERLRTGQPDDFEQMVLEAFQKKVTADVPIPPGATDIPDYPRRDTDAR